jgi:hypothetical protein
MVAIVTGLVLGLLTDTIAELVELRETAPNWIGSGKTVTVAPGLAANAVTAIKGTQAQTKAIRDLRLIVGSHF